MREKILLMSALCMVSSNLSAENAIVIEQPTSPLKIETYTAEYERKSSYSREGISHNVTLTNTSSQEVVAYRVTFNSFDVFNEDMGRGLGGISIETIPVGGTTSGGWKQSPYAAFSFRGYGTGVAYVSEVRLADGTIWSFNQQRVLEELQKISADLTAEIFEDGDGN